jgi:hypothetical protein
MWIINQSPATMIASSKTFLNLLSITVVLQILGHKPYKLLSIPLVEDRNIGKKQGANHSFFVKLKFLTT